MSARTALTLIAWLGLTSAAAAGDAVTIASDRVDAAATRAALEARVGAELAAWEVEVVDAEAGAVRVHLRARGDGRDEARTLALAGETEEERSRELAAAIALLIDEASDPGAAAGPEPEPAPAPAPPPPAAPAIRGFVGLGPRLGLGPPRAIDLDAGLELLGGVTFLRDHLQALAQLGWTTTHRRELAVHYLHLGAGVAGGALIAADRLWIGAGVLPRVMAIRAREGATTARLWNAAGDVFALGQFRAPVKKGSRVLLLASLRVGLEITLPSIIYLGATTTARRGDVRGLLAASVGVVW